jgi:hypothetical protein
MPDGFRLVGRELDLAARSGARGDGRSAEEFLGGEIVAASRLVGEGQRDRLSGSEADRLGAETEAPDLDDDLRRLGGGGGGDQEEERGSGRDQD